MPVLKLDLIMQCNGYGWRESYYRNFTSNQPGAALQVAQTLAAKRASCNGYGVIIEAWSCTDPLTEGRQGESVPFDQQYNGNELTKAFGSVTPSAAMNILWNDELTRLHRRTFFRGVWDAAVHKFTQKDTPDYGTWYAEFLKLRTYLLQQQFGWLHRPRAAEGLCEYSYGTGKQVPTFTFGEAFFPAEQLNTLQLVRFSKFNGGKSTLNRELVVKVLSDVTCEAVVPIAAGPMISGGKCIRYDAPQFVVATNIGVGKVGRRSPGRPLLRTPGRARAAARS